MNLYIVRHAIAVQRGTPDYEDDSQRPLTDKGRKKMKKIVYVLLLECYGEYVFCIG